MAMKHKTLEDFQRHVFIDLSKLSERGEEYFFDLQRNEGWARDVLLEINKHFLQGIGSHLVFARWIPNDLPLTDGRWADHLPLIINEKIRYKTSALKSMFFYGLPEPNVPPGESFTITGFILRDLRQKVIIKVNVLNHESNISSKWDKAKTELIINLPKSKLEPLFEHADKLLKSIEVKITAKNKHKVRISDFKEISDEGAKFFSLYQNYEKEELIEEINELSLQVSQEVKQKFGEVKNGLVKSFCFKTLTLCLMGRPKAPIKQILMFSFPHFTHTDKKDGVHQRSLCCFFLYTVRKLTPEEEKRLREGLAYVSSVVAGAEYARLVKREVLKGGRKAAVAQVMSRNMSHNIGSHVLAALAQESSLETNEIKILLNYLKHRQEFIADISTASACIVFNRNLYEDVLSRLIPIKDNERSLDGISNYYRSLIKNGESMSIVVEIS
jgi:hypothetical protein